MKPVDLDHLRQIQQAAQQKEALKIAEDKKNQPKSHQMGWDEDLAVILKILKASLSYWLELHAMKGLSFARYHGRNQLVLLRYKSESYKASISLGQYYGELIRQGKKIKKNYDENYSPDDRIEVERIPPPFSSRCGTGEIYLAYRSPNRMRYPEIDTELNNNTYRRHPHISDYFEELPSFMASIYPGHEEIGSYTVAYFMNSPSGKEFMEFVRQQGLIFKTEQNSSHKDDIDFIVSFE